MNKVYEIYKDRLLTKMSVSDVAGLVELKFNQLLITELGAELVNTEHKHYFTPQEFEDFFQPFVNDLKVRFENDQPTE